MSFANFDLEAQTRKSASAEDDIGTKLALYAGLAAQLNRQKQFIGSKRDSEGLRKQLDELVKKINTAEAECRRLLNAQDNKTATSLNSNDYVVRERLETEFSAVQRQLTATIKMYQQKKHATPLESSSERTKLFQSNPQQQYGAFEDHQQSQQAQQVQQLVLEPQIDQTDLEYHTLVTEQRENEITRIHEGVMEVNAIFKDLDQIVNQQGEQLDTIENNITNYEGNAQGAHKELIRAEEHQKQKNKCCVILLIVFSVILLTIILIAIS
ncbi:uncharacterized protein KQ657_002921 [Scheffersomyces spartinae]|uniref:t-SNARE coiled-coil homology domain-containing protein n=1 Tax=Scheffersomyces spartinae TaxID=45513 RepID=A0A9P8AH10_9ASCO|nr:uncharacterized protein KQ657_002921 [Scheffersomyces spartinae]KAG7191652.1 hypothetical protein KQ657_002921 [Scheffersomyces spartinae]